MVGVVAWDAGVATTRGEVLGRADLRLHENRPDAPLAAACDLVLVCVAGDDAAGCGAFLAKSLATREGIVPVLYLACDPGNHLPAFEAAFSRSVVLRNGRVLYCGETRRAAAHCARCFADGPW